MKPLETMSVELVLKVKTYTADGLEEEYEIRSGAASPSIYELEDSRCFAHLDVIASEGTLGDCDAAHRVTLAGMLLKRITDLVKHEGEEPNGLACLFMRAIRERYGQSSSSSSSPKGSSSSSSDSAASSSSSVMPRGKSP